jgi:hypothetical protein
VPPVSSVSSFLLPQLSREAGFGRISSQDDIFRCFEGPCSSAAQCQVGLQQTAAQLPSPKLQGCTAGLHNLHCTIRHQAVGAFNTCCLLRTLPLPQQGVSQWLSRQALPEPPPPEPQMSHPSSSHLCTSSRTCSSLQGQHSRAGSHQHQQEAADTRQPPPQYTTAAVIRV